jgi:drug/metabolite transporter (DMT)-like permease
MLNLLLAIASSALVSITMRLSGTKIKNNTAMLAVNYIMCAFLAWAYTGFNSWFLSGTGRQATVIMGWINGILYLAGFVLLQRSIRDNGVVLSATFIKLGLLVSMVVSVVFFGERPQVWQWAGFLLAVAAIVLMNYRPGEGKAGNMAGLLLLLLAGGGGDAMSKVFEELGQSFHSGHFLLYTFLVALALCISLCCIRGEKLGKWEVLFGLLIGIPNFFSAKFLLAALKDIAAVIVYPVYSVATILTVTVTGILLFREKLDKRQWIALAMILVALVLLNI